MVNCFCGNQALLHTSWTDHNPCRRFFSCAQIGHVSFNVNCGFFEWVDPPMCARSIHIIPGLLRSRNALQQLVNAMAAANTKLKICLFVKVVAIPWKRNSIK
ncbi:zinc finger, GRF-type [Artemisia annua]|uniref:Zinc finger, GRF-type n=1 Tax=Artemisia annua TaxID=35608 RepID=A0A2U1L5Q4_ARTAN|nr:zinc finger, GRF-type [Artemisia annua]